MVYTRNTMKINMMKYTTDSDDDDSDSDYVPSSENEDNTDEDNSGEEEEELEDEMEDLGYNMTGISVLMDKKKDVLLSEEFKTCIKKVSELDPDIYKYITAEYIKDKDKIKLCELYTILLSQEMFSIEWIEIRNLIKNEVKRINRKVCFFKDVNNEELQKKMEEFQLVKKQFDIPLKEQIILLDAPTTTKSYIYTKFKELSEYSTGDTEYAKIYTWLQCALGVPYNITKPLNITSDSMCTFLNNVYDKLNTEFYGLQKVKEQILLFLNMRLTNPNARGYNLALLGSKGVGKCFAKDTKILMSNNKLKCVQDIMINDTVMGIDGKPRTVLHLIKGFDKMYTVHQKFAEPYTVCKGHVLVLKCVKKLSWIDCKLSNISPNVDEVIKIKVEEFYAFPKRVQQCFVGIQTKVEFDSTNSFENITIDPYLLGLWLGNGSSTSIEFTIEDTRKIGNKLREIAKSYRTCIYPVFKQGNIITYIFKSDLVFRHQLEVLGIWGKFGIPSVYRTMSLANRRKFIAGFLDINAIYNVNTMLCHLNGNKHFINDFISLVRSVGLYATIVGNQEFISIGGDLKSIPCLNHILKNVNLDNSIKVSKSNNGFYHGFEITDDHLFLLSDYTVVHNCFAKDTSLQMFNGETRMVQDIKSGDELMGDDGYKRIVSETTSGREQMYKINQTGGGETYIVNESHILSLYNHQSDEYVDITVESYLKLDQSIRNVLLGYKRCKLSNSYVKKTQLYRQLSYGLAYAMCKTNTKQVYIPPEYILMMDEDIVEHVSGNIFERTYGSNCSSNYYKNINTKQELVYYLIGIILVCMYKNELTSIFEFSNIFELLNIDVRKIGIQDYETLMMYLINNDSNVLKYGYYFHIKVDKLTIDTYYGFTLEHDSLNRRFLLHDGTVVHNTHISRTLANILDFPFEQISIGNVTNAEILTGHQYTYVGSKPGAILNSLINMKYKNGIIFLDEFDKVQNIDVSNTLLHIVDGTQNHEYTDNYLGQQIKIDLSNIWFIFAMNAVPESGPLKDRLFVIEIDGYTNTEKYKITRDYLLPRICKNVGINSNDIILSEDMTVYLVNRFTQQEEQDNKGVRYIEKKLYDFVNKIIFLVNTKSTFSNLSFSIKDELVYPVNITQELVDKLLTYKSTSAPYTTMYC